MTDVPILLALDPPSGSQTADFAILDWLVVGLMLIVVLVGAAMSRKGAGDDFFLAGRSMPVWAVAISTSTALSAATSSRTPAGFRGDLGYLTFVCRLAAFIIVGFMFLPAIFKRNAVFRLVGQRFGASAGASSAIMFGLGRLLAVGARPFMTAIPFALVAFGAATKASNIRDRRRGGRRLHLPARWRQGLIWMVAGMRPGRNGRHRPAPAEQDRHAHPRGMDRLMDAQKLQMFDWSLSWSKPYTVWGAAIGMTLFLVAAYGTDQDMAQRLPTCRSPKKWRGPESHRT